MRDTILAIVLIINALSAVLTFFKPETGSFILLIISTCLTLLALFDAFIQKKHSLMRSFPIIARLRWVFEEEREKIQQYFIEYDLNGTPINREKRSTERKEVLYIKGQKKK